MVHLNNQLINGWSTADLPFYCAVLEMPGITHAEKKDKHYEADFANGVTVQRVNAWRPKEKVFRYYLHDVTHQDLRQFVQVIGNEGNFKRFDDDLITRYFKTMIDSTAIDEFSGYEVDVTYICEPFDYEEEYEIELTGTLINSTSAPMYPRIRFTITNTEPSFITIGNQTMYFKEGLNDEVIIECKHGLQDVTNELGDKLNGSTRGAFFEVEPGKHEIEIGPGISNARILLRWGWL